MRSGRRGVIGAVTIGCAVAVGMVAISLAGTVKLKNPGFETGTFRAWKTFEDGGGNWLVYRRGETPPQPEPVLRHGLAGPLTKFPKPPQGKRAAFVIQGGPGLNILHRVLRPRKGAVNKLRFFLFYRNTADRFHSPNHFEFGDGGMTVRGIPAPPPGIRNQQVRVDLLKRRAPLDSLKPRHILATLLRTRANDDLRRPYSKLRVNLTELGIKKRFRLRIAEVDNQAPLYVGVDGLKLRFKR